MLRWFLCIGVLLAIVGLASSGGDGPKPMSLPAGLAAPNTVAEHRVVELSDDYFHG